MVGSVTQLSVQSPDNTIFLRPVFSIAATKFLSSQEFIDDRSMGSCFGNTARICGHILPLKALVSTVESTTGTLNTFAAFASTRLLLMTDCRSKLATPNSICGWRSMSVTTQLSGVSSPFSLRFARLVCCTMVLSLSLEGDKVLVAGVRPHKVEINPGLTYRPWPY